MGLETSRWDAADHLDSKSMILAYLEAVFEDGDPELITHAINDVARARGVAPAEALTPQTDISVVIRTMKALGLELTAKAV
jgi:DNA-binding phage protein